VAGERILIVDDNVTNQKLISFLLGNHGYEVRTALDAAEALRELASFHPQLILMDLQLPGMDGFALARRLKSEEATCDIPIVAITAYAMRGDEQRAREAGCDGYVTKPVDTRALPALVERALARGGA
jgi:CheY-like chemotaxis protein